MTKGMARSGQHVPALDGVRGLAITLVLLFHFEVYLGPAHATGAIERTLAAGWSGVDLFFVLSGYLITGIIFDSKGTALPFRNFYARRALRIFPLYYGFLALYFVAIPALTSFEPPEASSQAWYWAYLSNVRVAWHGWIAESRVDHFWSLAVEEQYYIAWPILVLSLSRRALLRVCAAAMVVAIALRAVLGARYGASAAYTLTPCRMDALAAGSFLALLLRGPIEKATVVRAARVVGVVAALGVAVIVAREHGYAILFRSVYTLGMSLFSIACASLVALVACAEEGSLLRRAVGNPVLRMFGRYSYGMYVFQQPILVFMHHRGLTVDAQPRVLGSTWPMFVVDVAIAMAAILAVSLTSWHLYENRFLALKRYFEPRHAVRARARDEGIAVSSTES